MLPTNNIKELRGSLKTAPKIRETARWKRLYDSLIPRDKTGKPNKKLLKMSEEKFLEHIDAMASVKINTANPIKNADEFYRKMKMKGGK